MTDEKRKVGPVQMAAWIYRRDNLWKRGEPVAFLVVLMDREQLMTVDSEYSAKLVAARKCTSGETAHAVRMVGRKFFLL